MPFQCRSCRAPLNEVILDLGERPDVDDFRWPDQVAAATDRARLDLRLCGNCSLVQLGEPGVAGHGPHGHGALFSTSTTSHLAAWSAGMLASGIVRPGDRALDIAAGAGQLLVPLRDAGVEVVGLTEDAEFVSLARERRLDVRLGSLDSGVSEEMSGSGSSFDLVILNHSLAHTTDLAGLIGSVVAILAPDGTVVVEMHHLLELVRLGQFDLVTPAHGAYLSLIALEPLLAEHGLTAVSAESSSNHGGTVRLLIKRRSVARPGPTVEAMLHEERAASLDRPAGFVTLAAGMGHTIENVRHHLARAFAEGKLLVGYGAPARGAMLLDLADATLSMMPFTVDRSPAKQGRTLAGTNIPIRVPDVLDERRPDEILILPWPLRDEVEAQLARLHAQGTRFSVALPAWSTW